MMAALNVTRTMGTPEQCAAPNRVNGEIETPRSKRKQEHLIN